MNLNRCKWEAISSLKTSRQATDLQINGGYEHEGLYFSDSLNWVEKWYNDPPQQFMIAHGKITNYNTIDIKVYQRYIPFKKDSIYVLERIH